MAVQVEPDLLVRPKIDVSLTFDGFRDYLDGWISAAGPRHDPGWGLRNQPGVHPKGMYPRNASQSLIHPERVAEAIQK